MATFTAIQCKKQSAGAMRGVIDYVEQEEKTRWGDALLVTGSDCVPQSAFIEMQMTKPCQSAAPTAKGICENVPMAAGRAATPRAMIPTPASASSKMSWAAPRRRPKKN